MSDFQGLKFKINQFQKTSNPVKGPNIEGVPHSSVSHLKSYKSVTV